MVLDLDRVRKRKVLDMGTERKGWASWDIRRDRAFLDRSRRLDRSRGSLRIPLFSSKEWVGRRKGKGRAAAAPGISGEASSTVYDSHGIADHCQYWAQWGLS